MRLSGGMCPRFGSSGLRPTGPNVGCRFQFFFHPVPMSNPDRSLQPCPKCFAEWLVSGPPDVMHCSPCTAPDPTHSPNTVAIDALLDWMETHGGQIFIEGPRCNLAAVSDGVAWGPRFHSSCGRLLPFLIQFGSKSGPDCVNAFRF